VPRSRFGWVPFKANNFETLHEYTPIDGAHALACGASCRDFDTFAEAARQTGLPARVLLPSKEVAAYHKTVFSGDDAPKTVEVVRHDFDRRSWNVEIANARLVVIPIRPGTIQAAGVSVLFEAMALGKPVIISEGPATRGILPPDVAVVVPSGDPGALARAMTRLWGDAALRSEMGRRARAFALSLGGRERCAREIQAKLLDLVHRRRG
jgi:hypothetical protein